MVSSLLTTNSCLFVRNRFDLTNALDITPSYLRNPYSEMGRVIDYRNWQISLGRRFRALKIWFVMRSYGLNGMKDHIRKRIAFGDIFVDLVRGRQDLFEIITKPAFCLTVLRVRNPKAAENGELTNGAGVPQLDEVSNALTKEVAETINARGEIYLTPTVIKGINAIRVVSANPAAEEKYVRRAFEILVEVTEEVLRKRASN